MEKYQSYKPSRIQWLNEVPSNWVEKKNKHIFIEKKDEVGLDWKNYQLLSLSKKGVIKRDIDSGKGKFPESFENYKKIECDDLIFCLYDIEETPRSVGLSNFFGMITGSYKVFKCKENPKFVYYWYLTIDDFKGLKPFYTGMRNVVRPETFLSLNIYLPHISKQHQIVQFLDEKIELIDKLISTKESKISLLKEKRTSLVNYYVTKGINPNVKMKDSGVEWIGEIPEHWKISKIKHNIGIRTGYSFKSEEFVDDSYQFDKVPVVRISNIQDGYIDLHGSVYLPLVYTERYNDFTLLKGDILICLTGSLTGKVGIFEHELGLINQRVGKFYFKNENKIFNKYFSYFIKQDLVQKLIKQMGEGISENFPNVSHLDVIELNFTIPCYEEQFQIVKYLDSKTKEIDDLVIFEQKKIELLKEYRQSLISEVITGKIKVTTDE